MYGQLIDLNPNERHCFSFIFSLDMRDESYNTVGDLFGRICVSHGKEDVTFKVFNMIKGNVWIKNTCET